MKGTEQFTKIIKTYLDKRAQEDELFRTKYEKVNRPIEDIVAIILNTVKESGKCGYADEEIFSLAVHAAEEPDIKVGAMPDCFVVSNHKVELTEKEKAEQRALALKRFQEEELRKLELRQGKQRTAKAQASESIQPTLFDFEL